MRVQFAHWTRSVLEGLCGLIILWALCVSRLSASFKFIKTRAVLLTSDNDVDMGVHVVQNEGEESQSQPGEQQEMR